MREKTSFLLKAMFIIVCVSVLALSCSGALALDRNALSVSVLYADGWGGTASAQAVPLEKAGYENAYWAQLPTGTDMSSLKLEISDLYGEFIDFFPGSGDDLFGVYDCGSTADGATPVTVICSRADSSAEEIRIYISTQPVPAEEIAPSVQWPVRVTVHYVTPDGFVLCDDSTQDVYEGDNSVWAQPSFLPDGYALVGDSVQQVYASPDGTVQPGEVTFVYSYTPAVQWPVYVNVRYINEYGEEICPAGSAEITHEGENTVYASPSSLPEGYTLQGDGVMYVYADAEGNVQDEAVFVYTYTPPVQWPVYAVVRYVNENGEEICPAGMAEITHEGANEVYADPSALPAGYTLQGDGVKYVYADAEGNVQGEAVFVYTYTPPVEWPVYVTVHYTDENGTEIAESTRQDVWNEGECVIYALPALLPDGWVPLYGTEQTVYADALGNVQSDVTFVYSYTPQVSWPVTVNVRYLDENGMPILQDGVCEIWNEGENTVIASVDSLPEGYSIIGDTEIRVFAAADGTVQPAEAVFLCAYEAPVVWPAEVIVHYVSETGETVATDTAVAVYPGTTRILPEPEDLYVHYSLQDENASVTVYADEQGVITPAEVSFVYVYSSPTEWPRYVTVLYRDENGFDVAPEGTAAVNEGINTVYPMPEGLLENYVLKDEDAHVDVMADSSGNLSQNTVTFIYEYREPLTWPLPVTVSYRTRDGLTVATDTFAQLMPGENTLVPQPNDLLPGYESEAENPVINIVASEDGTLQPAEAVFYYVYHEPVVWPVSITVRHIDENGERVREDTACEIWEGGNTVVPGYDTVEGYILTGEGSVTVYADGEGNCTPEEAVFVYAATEAETGTVWPIRIPVRYTVEGSDESAAADGEAELMPGENLVYPDLSVLPEGCICQDEYVIVYAEQNGMLSQDEVIFVCYFAAEEEGDDTGTDTADDPRTGANAANVTVLYLCREDSSQVAPEQAMICYEGVTEIVCAPEGLRDGCELVSADRVYVTVSEYGADQDTVVFWFSAPAPVQTETPRPATEVPVPTEKSVNVVYIDRDNEREFYRESVLCTCGTVTPVYADARHADEKLGSGYEIVSENPVSVTVYADGTVFPQEAVFYFSRKTEEVVIYYRDAEGADVATATVQVCYDGMNTVYPRPADLKEGYEPDLSKSGETEDVYLEGGVMTPSYVIFYYKKAASADPGYLVQPMDSYARTKSDTTNIRSAPTAKEDNRIGIATRSEPVHVTGRVVNEDSEVWYLGENAGKTGFFKENTLTFLTEEEVRAYFATATPLPTATPAPDTGAGINLWAKTTSSKLNVRSQPDTGSSRVLQLENKNTKVWVLEMTLNANGEEWYHVIAKNREGYILARYLKLMSRSDSDAEQSKLNSPAPTLPAPTPAPTVPPTYTPVPTVYVTPEPTEFVTPTPVPTPTAAPYQGYAICRDQTPLRGQTSQSSQAVTDILPRDGLVLISAQVWQDGILWDYVNPQDRGGEGWVTDSELNHIPSDVAAEYLAKMQATSTPVPFTPTPAPYSGYCRTLGDTVPLRSAPDGQAGIIRLLPEGSVCWVEGQQYYQGIQWQYARYNEMTGYIRADQTEMMTNDQITGYLDSLRTPTPSPAPVTPEPVTEDSLSCYAFISKDKVNLRDAPDGNRLELLPQYSLLVVEGEAYGRNGDVWYAVTVTGSNAVREGFVSADYVTRLKLGEVDRFLSSEEYISSFEDTGSRGQAQDLQSYEDYNMSRWQNPGASVTYAPFNPYTPVPNFDFGEEETDDGGEESTATVTPYVFSVAANITATPAMPDIATYRPDPGIPSNTVSDSAGTVSDENGDSGAIWIIVVIGLAVIAAAVAVYACSIHSRNEKRREAVRRQAAGMAQRSAAERTQQQPSRPAPANAQNVTFMPPRGGAPRAPQSGAPSELPQHPAAPAAPAPSSETNGNTARFRPAGQNDASSGLPQRPAAPAVPVPSSEVNGNTVRFRPAGQNDASTGLPQRSAAPAVPAPSSETAGNTMRFRPAPIGQENPASSADTIGNTMRFRPAEIRPEAGLLSDRTPDTGLNAENDDDYSHIAMPELHPRSKRRKDGGNA